MFNVQESLFPFISVAVAWLTQDHLEAHKGTFAIFAHEARVNHLSFKCHVTNKPQKNDVMTTLIG